MQSLPDKILVTGGAGYIGSHCVLALLEKGEDVIVFDNLSTGHIETVDKLSQCGHVEFVRGDLTSSEDTEKVFAQNQIGAVFHFAALSQVGESIKEPEKYRRNNVCGTENLLAAMVRHGVKKMIFSSTASIYGEPKYIPIDEEHEKNPVNPYGKTKLTIENMLDDYDKSFGLKSVRLRYFNVTGADEKGRTGEWHDPETHLIPNILKSVFDKDKVFELYGDDYPTKDGTCVRDYICVQDIVKAHLLAFEYLKKDGQTNCFNLGTGNGYTVREVFELCSKTVDKKISLKILPKRAGDAAVLVADNKKAAEILGWKPEKSLEYGILTAYQWNEKMYKHLLKKYIS